MDTTSYTKAREGFAALMSRVCQDHNPIIITRQDSESVVLMSLEDFNAIKETAYLLSNPTNAGRLSKSIAEIESGKAKTRKLLK